MARPLRLRLNRPAATHEHKTSRSQNFLVIKTTSTLELEVPYGNIYWQNGPARAKLYRTVQFYGGRGASRTIYTAREFQMKNNFDLRVETTKELGRFARDHRKSRGLTLETVSGLGNLSPRFLSEFERGKETAEIGKVLKALRILGLEVIVRPRGSK